MKVQNMINSNSKTVPDQFIIYNDMATFFQSYDSIIVKLENGKVFLDENKWDCSKTTSKYLNLFLSRTTAEIKARIKTGEYILSNLN